MKELLHASFFLYFFHLKVFKFAARGCFFREEV